MSSRLPSSRLARLRLRSRFTPRGHQRDRGFTLIELMVALSAGLFLSIFVFMLTRDVSRFFQAESRLSDATMSAVIGFERLKADIARAGFLASPNLRRDPSRCPRPPTPLTASAWATVPSLVEMGLLYVYRGEGGASLTAPGQAFLTLNGLTPDRLRLFGNYQSTDQFPARSVTAGGTNVNVILEPASGPLLRLGYVAGAPTAAGLIEAAFPQGRALRLVNAEGEEQYGIISLTNVDGAGTPSIQVNIGTLLFKSSNQICGIRGHGSDIMVNVVNIIDYRLDNVVRNSAAYQDLKPTLGEGTDSQANTDDSTRTDLIREEIDPASPITGIPVAFENSQQIVAEYAVDFRVGLTAVTEATTLALTRYAEGDALIDGFARPNAAAAPNQGPHYIRAVRPRLSVRARAADRAGDVNTAAGSAVAPGLYRVALGTNSFARVRSLTATIATRNAREALWQ